MIKRLRVVPSVSAAEIAPEIAKLSRRGLLRNVCVALGNIGDKAALPALEKAAADPEPLISEHACWAIEQIKRKDKVGRAGNGSSPS